ncbi:cytosine permease [Streptomyces indonesiensis]
MSSEAQQGRRGTTVESNGVNPVPDAERRGKPRGLFAVWFAWNISILGISYGIFVFGLGLNVWQTIVAGTAATSYRPPSSASSRSADPARDCRPSPRRASRSA